MKRLFAVFALFLIVAATPVMAQEAKVMTGPITIADLLDLPGWFGEDYLSYRPAPHYLDRIPQFLEDVDIICVMGTWCSDSKRDVPRMIRILQSKNVPPEKLKLIGVDRDKRSPNGEASQYGVEKVPTFIFIRNGREIGRIVEAPLASLEKDMLGIIDPDAGKVEAAPVPAVGSDDGTESPDGTESLDGADRGPEEERLKKEQQRIEQERLRHEAEMQKK